MSARMVPRVLSIAGTDPIGGAGIHADLKTIGALGGYGMAAVTALVAQNTVGVRSLHVPPVEFLIAQLDVVGDDAQIDAVKLGMLHSTPLVHAVTRWLERSNIPLVILDPVMVATSDDRLLDADAEQAIRELCAAVSLVTPNLPELAVLAGCGQAKSWEEAVEQAQMLRSVTGTDILLKGGHLPGESLPDAIVTADGVFEVPGRRIHTTNTHGTGCSLSSAMATLAAQGHTWEDALVRAKDWLAGAIREGASLEVGQGNGPVDHFHEQRGRAAATWCADIWDETAGIRDRIGHDPFVKGLCDGSLDGSAFVWYLEQDALYLREYSRVLAVASSKAPTGDEQAFWARCAASALTEEAQLHQRYLGGATVSQAGPITSGYTNYLRSVAWSGSYGELIAAVLPCFWLYSDLGTSMSAANHAGHPYRDWLDAYADPDFAESTDTAVQLVNQAAMQGSANERDKMARAFEGAMLWEHAFFKEPLNISDRA